MNEQLLERFLKNYMPEGEQYKKKDEYLAAVSEMFTDEELEMYITAAGFKVPFSVEQLSDKCQVENFEQVLKSCIDKFLIRIHEDEESLKYIANTMFEVHGLYLRDSVTNKRFAGMSINHAISDYALEALNVGKGGTKIPTPNHMKRYKFMIDPSQAKRIELGTEIPDKRRVSTTNDVIELIKRQTVFAFAPCSCRVTSETTEGYHCKTTAQCIFFNEIALYFISIGQGKQISKQEATDYIIDSGKKGLVHITDNVKDKAYVLCNCCRCCCLVMKSVQRGEIHAVMASKYKPVHNISECVSCGECERICPVHAIELRDGDIHFDMEKCMGCGNCANLCLKDAIVLELRENYGDLESKFNNYVELHSVLRL